MKTYEATEQAYKNGYEKGIKDFAENLKEYKYQSSDWSHGEHPFVVEENDIDELVEEMVGADMAEMVVKDTNVLTNADRIRAMSDEELANKLYALSNCEMQDCKECLLFKVGCGSAKSILEWLKQPAEGE